MMKAESETRKRSPPVLLFLLPSSFFLSLILPPSSLLLPCVSLDNPADPEQRDGEDQHEQHLAKRDPLGQLKQHGQWGQQQTQHFQRTSESSHQAGLKNWRLNAERFKFPCRNTWSIGRHWGPSEGSFAAGPADEQVHIA